MKNGLHEIRGVFEIFRDIEEFTVALYSRSPQMVPTTESSPVSSASTSRISSGEKRQYSPYPFPLNEEPASVYPWSATGPGKAHWVFLK
jgi:hypothetical protein